jgi:hypothetical protein
VVPVTLGGERPDEMVLSLRPFERNRCRGAYAHGVGRGPLPMALPRLTRSKRLARIPSTMTTARRRVRLAAEAALLLVALAAASASAQPRGRVLDGSSPAKLETSVALLQNDLAGRRREELDVALAMIWMNRTANSGDLNGDGEFDVDDMRRLEIRATDLLTEIRRGNLISAIEEREETDGDYTAADYFAQLHGLGYDEIVSLAGRPTVSGYLDAVRQAREQLACQSQGRAFAQASESRAARRRTTPCGPRGIGASAGNALAAAVVAMNERRYSDARATVAELLRGRLSPYERSMAEQVLSSLSEAEGNPVAAREHLLNALVARGLTPDETRLVLDRIRTLDARLSGEPQ